MVTPDPPLVSAVCVTGKSPSHVENFLGNAIRWFSIQDYPKERRELVIVTDAELPAFAAEDIPPNARIVHADPGLSLGDLRNTGLDHAKGEMIIQWDDDDAHCPQRIPFQVRAALEHGTPQFLVRQLCYSWDTDVAFIRDTLPLPIVGTILHEQTEKRYPPLPRHEDLEFAKLWPQEQWVATSTDPRVYVRFSHGASTSGHQHVMRHAADWKPGTWAIPQSWHEHLEQVLRVYHRMNRGGSQISSSSTRPKRLVLST